MNKKTQEVLLSTKFASHVLFHKGMFAAFGGDPCMDMVVMGVTTTGVKESILYEEVDKTWLEHYWLEAEFCAEMFTDVFKLADPALSASFRITSWQVDFIQRAIKSINATHLILFGDEDGVFFNCFDAFRFVPDARMRRKHETKVLTHQLKDTPVEKFHVTLNAASLNKLPRLSLDVGIGKNKVVIFTDDKSGNTYLLRDLEVALPMVNFFSDRLQDRISLSLVANSLFQDPDTSQLDSPEVEFDESDLVHQLVP
jgi:hypothetical protein